MAKHSPGPWEVFQSGRDEALYVASKQGNVVAFMGPEDEDENADLIAAAPELLAALIAARRELRVYHQELDGEDYNNPSMNAVIAKATGEKV